MWKNWLTLSSSDSPEIAFTFVKATRTKREEDERSPGRPNHPIPLLYASRAKFSQKVFLGCLGDKYI